MVIKQIIAGAYAVNCYILSCKNTKKTAIIDPGGNGKQILAYIQSNQLDVSYIILTHPHGDHIGAIPQIKNQINVPILLHGDDESMLENAHINLSSMMGQSSIALKPERLLNDGETIELGDLRLNIIHTPGHTPGGICIKVKDVLFTGDTLFANSIGRTDFPGGSYQQIIDSIKKKLLIFDDETKILPGHGPMSTIGAEKRYNPFIK
jgi:hydroxyacylglutathione hydrolase